MKKNSLIVFSGREMFRLLIRNKDNRAVCKEDLKDNEYLSTSSVKKAEGRVKKLVKSIKENGWKNMVVYAFRMSDGVYILLDGNHRRKALEICVNEGILPDYPEWDVIDMSLKINPKTGTYYTFEEAQAEVEDSNIHAQKPHTATDIIESHAGMGSELCKEICRMSKTYGAATTTVSDLVAGLGSSKEDNVSTTVGMAADHEKLLDVETILRTISVMDNNMPEGSKKFITASHYVSAFKNVYDLCKSCGVEKEFCELMEAASMARRPNPFYDFFKVDQISAYTDKIFYLIDGFFDGRKIVNITDNMYKIRAAFEKAGLSASIAKFHRDIALGRKGVRLEFTKKAA